MAVPRMFISSTCFDLHEVRRNIRDFISNFGYEPVMSEYGDIFMIMIKMSKTLVLMLLSIQICIY